MDDDNDTIYVARGSYKIKDGTLSYVGHDITKIPPVFGQLHGSEVKCLDLSYNNITNLLGLDRFIVLKHLILDSNQLGDSITFPLMKNLETLSLNNNLITDLESFMKKLRRNLPNLKHLSLLKNKACPNELSDQNKDEDDYKRYRFFVLYHLKSLKFLDCTAVTPSELREAASKGEFMLIKRPKPVPESDETIEEDLFRYTPLPETSRRIGEHKGAYGQFRFRYSTKQSEGNRFIVNKDL